MLSTDADEFGGENVTEISITKSDKQSNLSVTPNVIVFMVLGMTIFILNFCCLVVLSKEKKLKQKRFYMLTIFLSVSDAATGLVLSASSFQAIYYILTGNGLPPYCFLSGILVTTTLLFSLLQTLWICLERLIATFPAHQNLCEKVAIVPTTVVFYLLCAAFVVPVNVIFGNFWSKSCSVVVIFGQNRITVLSIFQPLFLIIIIAVLIIYIVVILRVYKSWKQVHPCGTNNRRQQTEQDLSTVTTQLHCISGTNSYVEHNTNNDNDNIDRLQSNSQQSQLASSAQIATQLTGRTQSSTQRVWKTSVTLSLLVLVMLVSVVPKVSIGLAVVNSPKDVNLAKALGIADLFLFINPLLDPLIYVFRIPSFRKRLKCK
ncbi:HCAR1 [Mytilus coruscus]|uniref:HCAR1 n=1 Tax=Mytilus coruscus TaxID=42192 RepID=A0A6J8CH70_MYTCO|nr:HCAR1 [Mytilus coruscus]